MKTKFVPFAVLLFMLVAIPVYAQETIDRIPPQELVCGGELVAGEFTTARQERVYTIFARAGTTISLSIKAIAQQPQMVALITDRTNFGITISAGIAGSANTAYNPLGLQSEILLNDIILPATGEYSLRVLNSLFWYYDFSTGEYYVSDPDTARGGIGAFNIVLECIGPDGRPITPVDPTPAPEPTAISQPSFDFGVPALPAQDFSVGVTLPLQLDVANMGSISPGFQGIFGYTFTASAGDMVTLTFNREQGNLSLGLAVIAEDNTIAFQSTLAGASNLTVSFPVAVAGNYTIGVYVTNIAAPIAPENTTFTIQATIGS
ncbi:MAG: PPC domain-containing protein [Anaerolineae bacterium]|nr:PPC domain-containing protein [Anaerolineae bacterium]